MVFQQLHNSVDVRSYTLQPLGGRSRDSGQGERRMLDADVNNSNT